MTVDQSDLFADVGRHVADVCVRCYQLESILTEFFTAVAEGLLPVDVASVQALERLRAMGDT